MPSTKTLSPKSVETLDRLNTIHEDWGIMQSYETRVETVKMNVKCRCTDCHGKGRIYGPSARHLASGRVITLSQLFDELLQSGDLVIPSEVLADQEKENEERDWADYSYPDGEDCWDRYTPVSKYKNNWTDVESHKGWFMQNTQQHRSVDCSTCYSHRANRSMGYVTKLQDVECDVKYPLWPHDTGFQSRFHGHDCEICGKNGIKSGSIPIIAVREDGSVEGMFVGNACITKMGHAKIKSVAQQLESAGSLEYGGVERKMGSGWRPTFYVRSYETHDATVQVE